MLTILLLLAVTWIGLRYSMLWLSVISGLILVAYLMGFRKERHAVASGKPKIRPIIVKRRYTGPASIYPSKMKIKVHPNWDTREWWERALGGGGAVAGLLAQGFAPKGPARK